MTRVLIRERQREIGDIGTQGEGREIGNLHSQAKGCLEPPEAGRGKEDSLLEPLGRAQPRSHLDLGLLNSRTVENKFLSFQAFSFVIIC